MSELNVKVPSRREAVLSLLENHSFIAQGEGVAFAPVNFALIKYWGKRDEALHLPITDSLSLSIDNIGTHTKIKVINQPHDIVYLNDECQAETSVFATNLTNYLDLFRPRGISYEVHTQSDVAVASGLASSASGFAALALALNDLYQWQLAPEKLSILARLGSGSACRSLWPGFVRWQKGERTDGLDSHGIPLQLSWPQLSIGLLLADQATKKISSRQGMAETVMTSSLYDKWPERVASDLIDIVKAIKCKDFTHFGQIVEDNAIFMHQTANKARPAIDYSTPQTYQYRSQVQHLRRVENVNVYFTQDAGPHLKVLYLSHDVDKIRRVFPRMRILAVC